MTSAEKSGDLRARRRNATRMEIHRAALALFEANGFDDTTVDEIAEEAGVSSRTFFRYFPTKEECIIDDLFGFDEVLRDCLEAADPDTFSLADVEAAYRTVMVGFAAERGDVASHFKRVQKLVLATPSLSRAALGRYADQSQRWPDVLAERGSVRTRAHIRLILEIAHLEVQCAFEEWAEGEEAGAAAASAGADRDLVTIYDEVCGRVRAV